ncbi:MAG: hypothetical protein Q8M88_02135 [Phenylobacterium sp.]|uniref:hypothetical protein n=1 Tax=Phenylobacterium sp. TaxID=1871053 RepID=UPI0027337725|nr:hypothetical protein [Phenylobacterium sp.]MDP3173217.1 hypothetical protein [Phenylobacterium sp.]
MSVRLDGDVIRLEGACRVEEAETLVGLLQAQATRAVDLSQCRHLHGAVVQVLLAFAPPILGEAPEPFIRDLLAPAVRRNVMRASEPSSATTDFGPFSGGADGPLQTRS